MKPPYLFKVVFLYLSVMTRKLLLSLVFGLLLLASAASQDLQLIKNLQTSPSEKVDSLSVVLIDQVSSNYKLVKTKIKPFKRTLLFFPVDVPKDKQSFPEHRKKAIVVKFLIKDNGDHQLDYIQAPKEILLNLWKTVFVPDLKDLKSPPYKQHFFDHNAIRYRIKQSAGFDSLVWELNSRP